MIKLLLLAVVPFMTEHRNVAPKTEVSTNFYGSVTGIVDNAYIQAHGGGGGGVDTNAVRDIVREEITPATNSLNQTLSYALAGKLDSRAAERGSISWNVSQDDTADLNVSAISANFDGEIFVAGDSAFNGRVSCTYGWEGFESNGEILPVYLDSLEWRTTGNRSLADYGITDATPLSMISATNLTFSNAVLAVQIDTNTVAQIGELKQFFDDLPTGTVGTSLGGIILALLSAAAWLKKNKVGSFESVGGASATVENGVAKLSDFFTKSDSFETDHKLKNAVLEDSINSLIDYKVGDINAVLAAALDGTEVA